MLVSMLRGLIGFPQLLIKLACRVLSNSKSFDLSWVRLLRGSRSICSFPSWIIFLISLEKILKRLNRKLKEVEKSLNNPKSYEKDEDSDFHALLRDQVSLTNEIELSEEQWFDLNQKLEEG